MTYWKIYPCVVWGWKKCLLYYQKKKDNIRVESVNTDATYIKTPEFLGISKKTIKIINEPKGSYSTSGSKFEEGIKSI